MRLNTLALPKGYYDLCNDISLFIKHIFIEFTTLPVRYNEFRSKYKALKGSVAKVENISFTIRVRGAEYPPESLSIFLQSLFDKHDEKTEEKNEEKSGDKDYEKNDI